MKRAEEGTKWRVRPKAKRVKVPGRGPFKNSDRKIGSKRSFFFFPIPEKKKFRNTDRMGPLRAEEEAHERKE